MNTRIIMGWVRCAIWKEGSKRLTLYSNYCIEKCGIAVEKVEEFPKRELGGPN